MILQSCQRLQAWESVRAKEPWAIQELCRAATGERADVVVVDDRHSVDQAESNAERRMAVEWFTGTMATRLNDFANGCTAVLLRPPGCSRRAGGYSPAFRLR